MSYSIAKIDMPWWKLVMRLLQKLSFDNVVEVDKRFILTVLSFAETYLLLIEKSKSSTGCYKVIISINNQLL